MLPIHEAQQSILLYIFAFGGNGLSVLISNEGAAVKQIRGLGGIVPVADEAVFSYKFFGSSRKVRDRDGEKPNKSEEEMIVSIPISKSFGDFNLVVKALKLSG